MQGLDGRSLQELLDAFDCSRPGKSPYLFHPWIDDQLFDAFDAFDAFDDMLVYHASVNKIRDDAL
ncbi:MAG: hypothetical protein AB9879_11700 [Methanothrix sp.]